MHKLATVELKDGHTWCLYGMYFQREVQCVKLDIRLKNCDRDFFFFFFGIKDHIRTFVLTLCPCGSSFLFSIVISLLWKEGAGLCVSRAFVCLFCTC